MKIRHILLATTCTAALARGGCASNPSGAQVGTGVGAVVGGVAGNAVFGGPVGTIGGAAAGAYWPMGIMPATFLRPVPPPATPWNW